MPADVAKFKFRLVLLGSHGTGKTSILNRFLFKKFEAKYKPTVEDLFSKQFDLGSMEIQVDFLDTSGSMQFPAMRRLSITTGSAFMIVYSVDDESSYEVLKMCMAEIQEIRPDFQDIPIVFAGNKCETVREKRRILKEVVSNYVHYELPRLRAKVIECSCKDNINIDNLFRAYLSLARVSLSASCGMSCSAGAEGRRSAGGLPSSSLGLGSGAAAACARQPAAAAQQGGNQERQQQQQGASSGRLELERSAWPVSMKDALSVRKSCDATIPSVEHRRLQLGRSRCALPARGEQLDSGAGRAGPLHGDGHGEEREAGQWPVDDQINLAAAIQTKLQVSAGAWNSGGGGSKLRSRSLIWRPARKSGRANSSKQAAQPDCRVS